MNTSAHDMQAAIADLARSMHHSSSAHPITADGLLYEVTTSAARLVTAVDHAGVSLIRRHGKDHTIESTAPTGEAPRLIDKLQEEFGDGPCLDAIRGHHTVHVCDYTTETRWPQLARAIVDHTSVRSSLSIQLYTDQQSFGALNLYSDSAAAFDEDTVQQALALAAHAAVGLSGARRDAQFRSALASRDIIGQAKGIIMERFSIDALQAFRLLSKLSQGQNVPVAQIAAQLVEVDHPAPKPNSN
ncbi:GAF and ANTAR domain-containing protein [Rhodococcoides yunnanense]|uniref:GAF and ANTAR domain-containing protein n=1 Tax=Rhodococcoides yunnanense TaxID=278209 RepID=UPI000934EBE7|nr:GAF and ANTAR domain-containing protein [Rhodococcus yunnanensis]